MAYFDYTLLTADMAAKTGYKLYSDFGEISPDDMPHRRLNEFVLGFVNAQSALTWRRRPPMK